MPITNEIREQRKNYIGSSDSPIIVGVNTDEEGKQYRNIGDLWLEKTGRLNDSESTAAQDMGTDLEEAIIRMFERQTSKVVGRNLFVRSGIFSANLDGAVFEDGSRCGGFLGGGTVTSETLELHKLIIAEIVEAKSTGNGDFWGKEDITDVPMSVLVQAQHQMMVAKPVRKVTNVPVLLPAYRRFSYKSFLVHRNDELIEEIRQRGEWFWSYVRADQMPPDVVPVMDSLKRRKRNPEVEPIQLSAEVSEWWEEKERARIRRHGAETDEEEWKRKILDALGDAEAGRLLNGDKISYYEQNGGRHVDLDVLELELTSRGLGELFQNLVYQPRFRVLRKSKAKIGKARKS